MNDRNDELPVAALAPAPIGARVGAGLLDLLALVVLSVLAVRGTMLLLGGSMPMVAVSSVVVAWSVLPMWAFQATPSMRLFGLEVVARGGDRADFISLLVRELIGRGLFAVAYLATLVVGLVGALLGRTVFTMPMGLGAVLASMAMFLLAVAMLGHVAVFLRPDGRTLADLLSGTMVVRRRAGNMASPTDDLDPEELALVARRTGAGAFLALEGVVVALVFLVPLLTTLGLPSPDFDRQTAGMERLRLEEKTRRFEANPADRKAARELVWALEGADDAEAADDIRRRHREARAEAARKREGLLRSRLEQAPTDFETLGMLIELLDEQDRVQDARTVYSDFVAADGSAAVRAGYGIWLYRRDLNEEAVIELRRARDEGAESPRLHSYLGFALHDLGRLEEAAAELRVAVEGDPSLETSREVLAQIEAELLEQTEAADGLPEETAGP